MEKKEKRLEKLKNYRVTFQIWIFLLEKKITKLLALMRGKEPPVWIGEVAPGVLPIPPVGFGGTEVVITGIIKNLVKRNCRIVFFGSGDSKIAKLKGVKLVEICPKNLLDLSKETNCPLEQLLDEYRNNLAITVKRWGKTVDILHNHIGEIIPFFGNSNIPKQIVVNTIHTLIDEDYAKICEKYGERDNIHYVSISNDQRNGNDVLRSKNKVPDINFVANVYNGMDDPEQFNPKPISPFYAVFVGRALSAKGLKEAIEIAKKAGLPIKTMASIYNSNPEIVKYYAQIKKDYRDDPDIEWLGDVSVEEKNKALREATVFIGPNSFLDSSRMARWYEPFGYTWIEANFCGVPVIATKGGSMEEIVDDEVSGFIIEFDQKKGVNIEQGAKIVKKISYGEAIKEIFSEKQVLNELEGEKIKKIFSGKEMRISGKIVEILKTIIQNSKNKWVNELLSEKILVFTDNHLKVDIDKCSIVDRRRCYEHARKFSIERMGDGYCQAWKKLIKPEKFLPAPLSRRIESLYQQQRSIGFIKDILKSVVYKSEANKDFRESYLDVQLNEDRAKRAEGVKTIQTKGERINNGCHICAPNMPIEQKVESYRDWNICANPFPIFDHHFTIAYKKHSSQILRKKDIKDMIGLIKKISSSYRIIFNGKKSGVSIPRHKHFQMFKKELPIEKFFAKTFFDDGIVKIGKVKDYPAASYLLESINEGKFLESIDKIKNVIESSGFSLNVIFKMNGGVIKAWVFPRGREKTDYFENTFGSVEMGGIIVTSSRKVFENITLKKVKKSIAQASISNEEAVVIEKMFLYPKK